LIYAASDFPDFGDPKSPANAGKVANYFLEKTEADTNVPNVVTAVLADYRGYDTMFETVVIFTAGIAIIAILRMTPGGSSGTGAMPPAVPRRWGTYDGSELFVGSTCKLLIPVIQLFALYVSAHGHHSPGGGFQGGVILGASFILLAISRDLDSALLRLSERRYLVLASVGILIYAGFGLMCFLLGSEFLDYSVLSQIMPATDPVMARSHSMLGVEIGVAFTVSAIMFAIYANLSTAGDLKNGL
jgi:multicomponent Na+:H+ antiporter subunit B